MLVGIVAATPPLFVDAVASGAVQHQWTRGCPGVISPTITRFDGPSIPAQLLAPTVDGLEVYFTYDATQVSGELSFRNGERHTAAGLLARPGAVEHLDIVEQTDHGELWISDVQAEALGVRPGATVSFDFPGVNSATVRGIYRDMTTGALGPYWCSVEKLLRAQTIFTDAIPPPRAIVDPSAYDTFLPYLGTGRRTFTAANDPLTLPEVRRLTGQLPALREALDRVAGEALTEYLQSAYPMEATVVLSEGLTRLEARAVAVRDAVRTAIVPLSVLALVCALAVTAAIGSMWTRARRNDVVALTSIGVGPWSIGAKAALEYLVPVAAGGIGGAALGRIALNAYAPAADLSPGTFTRATWWALGAALVATVLIGLVAAATARGVMRAVPRRVPSFVRWFPLEAVLGFAAWRSYRSFRHGSLIELHNKDTVVGDAALTFPLLFFAAVAVFVARLWYLAFRRSRRPLRHVSVGLAVRRLRAGRSLGAVLVGLGALAVGVAIYGAGLVSSLSYTKTVKAKTFVGADVLARVTHILDQPTPGATQIGMSRDYQLGETKVDLLAIDPATFAQAAFWEETFADRPVQELIDALATRADGAIIVGDAPKSGVLVRSGRSGGREVYAVAEAAVFPTMRNNKPLVVITRQSAQEREFALSRDVLASGASQSEWMNRLRELGTMPVWSIVPDQMVDSSEMLFAEWTFVFVRALGVFVAGLVIVALLLHLVARQRQQRVAVGMLRRMGIGPFRQRLALLVEVLALAVAMVAVGVGAANFVSQIVVPRLDPLPIVAPRPIDIVPIEAIVGLVVAAIVCAAAGTLAAHASAARSNLAEALRDD